MIEDELALVHDVAGVDFKQLPPRPQRGRRRRAAQGRRDHPLMAARHRSPKLRAAEAPGALRIVPLGGLGEVGRNMTVFEIDGKLLIVDCRRAVPGDGPAGRRPDPAGLRPHPGPARRRARRRADARPRGPHRRRPVPAAAPQGHPAPRLGAHPRLRRGEAAGAPHQAVHAHGEGGADREAGPVRARVRRGEPLDPGCARRRDQARRAGTVLHTGDFKMDQLPLDGRLTDLRAFARLGEAGVDLFLADSTNADVPGFTAARALASGPCSTTSSAARPRRVIVASFSSHVHRVQQVLDAAARERPQGRAASAAAWCATWASRPTSAT